MSQYWFSMKNNHEFYRDQSGCFVDAIYDLESEDVCKLTDMDDQTVLDLFDHCLSFPEARKAFTHLNILFPGDRRKILRQFILCNWSALDDKFDITLEKLNYESVPCEHKNKGTCPLEGEGIVCICQ